MIAGSQFAIESSGPDTIDRALTQPEDGTILEPPERTLLLKSGYLDVCQITEHDWSLRGFSAAFIVRPPNASVSPCRSERGDYPTRTSAFRRTRMKSRRLYTPGLHGKRIQANPTALAIIAGFLDPNVD